MIEEQIKEVIDHFTRIFGCFDCFKTWVENINCGEKYIVWCSYRVRNCLSGQRTTEKKRMTIYPVQITQENL